MGLLRGIKCLCNYEKCWNVKTGPKFVGRIGAEISTKTVKRAFDVLASLGQVTHTRERRWRRYCLISSAIKDI